jgi:hypothetical protein
MKNMKKLLIVFILTIMLFSCNQINDQNYSKQDSLEIQKQDFKKIYYEELSKKDTTTIDFQKQKFIDIFLKEMKRLDTIQS